MGRDASVGAGLTLRRASTRPIASSWPEITRLDPASSATIPQGISLTHRSPGDESRSSGTGTKLDPQSDPSSRRSRIACFDHLPIESLPANLLKWSNGVQAGSWNRDSSQIALIALTREPTERHQNGDAGVLLPRMWSCPPK